MEEQYITEKCINKLNDIIDRLRLINPSFITSVTIRSAQGYYYYSLFIRYSDIKSPVQITIEEYWLYTGSFYSLLGNVIDEICKTIRK